MGEPLAARIRLDLDWLGHAAPLMSDSYWASRGFSLASPPAARPSQLPDSAKRLHAWLEAQGPRAKVGRWFEQLHDAILADEAGVELLVHQHPLRDAGRTLGELDALYRRGETIVHREIAVKYYLGVEDSEDPAAWWGPSRRDRLDLKLSRMTEHQLRLPQVAGDAWPDDLPRPQRSEALMLGALFRRPGGEALPEGCHEQVTTGLWFEASHFDAEQRAQTHWVHLDKPWWLSPQQVRYGTPIPAELPPHPVLVGCMRAEGPQRAFVVPDGWFSSRD